MILDFANVGALTRSRKYTYITKGNILNAYCAVRPPNGKLWRLSTYHSINVMST